MIGVLLDIQLNYLTFHDMFKTSHKQSTMRHSFRFIDSGRITRVIFWNRWKKNNVQPSPIFQTRQVEHVNKPFVVLPSTTTALDFNSKRRGSVAIGPPSYTPSRYLLPVGVDVPPSCGHLGCTTPLYLFLSWHNVLKHRSVLLSDRWCIW